jgi:signal transduction histidine kinase
MAGNYNYNSIQETKPINLIVRSKKIMSQRSLALDNNLSLRLSYARWLIVLGLFAFYVLEISLRSKPLVFNNNAIYLMSGYGVFNLVYWLVALGFGKHARLLITTSLVLDLVFTTVICYLLESTLYAFAAMPAFLIIMLVGLPHGLFALLLVAAVNFYDIYLTNFTNRNLKDDLLIQFYGWSGALLLLVITFYILTQNPKALLRVTQEMLEEELSRVSQDSIQEMQNRTKSVYRVANTLSSTLDYQQVIKAILHEIETVFDVSCGAVLIFEGNLDKVQVVDSLRLTPEEEIKSITLQKGLLKQVLNSSQPHLVSEQADLDEIRQFFPTLRSCQTIMLLPLRAGIEVFGLLLIASRNPEAYSTSDVELMVSMATHTVLAMQNATLYRNLLDDRNKLLTQEEEVRHELARNLHDGPAQAVASFSMQTEVIRRLFKTEPDRALEELNNLGKLAQQTSREIRTLLYELRPLVLESQGLVSALEQYSKRFPSAPGDPYVHFSTKNFSDRLAPQVESTIFTVLQEAVNNARKHARARNIWLQLEIRDGFIIASAQDDGRGFDVTSIEQNYDKRGSLGLNNIKERAALVGGQSTIHSVVGQGTIVAMRIPINENTIPTARGQLDY